jgi:hypothetical protein
LIKQRNLDAEEATILDRAYELALRELGLVDRSDTKIVAGKIIEVDATGITGPEEIAAAIKRLGDRSLCRIGIF